MIFDKSSQVISEDFPVEFLLFFSEEVDDLCRIEGDEFVGGEGSRFELGSD